MPAPILIFDPVYDIHLVGNQTIELESLLKINGVSIAAYLGGHPNISLSFEALFNGTVSGNQFSGLGITLNTQTGQLAINNAVTAQTKNNFVVSAVVTDTNDNDSKRASLRVHVHEEIDEIWVSPKKITVQKDINGFYFSVRARFNDNVVAQISQVYRGSNGSSVTYTINPSISFQWASTTANLIDPNSGEINPTTPIANGEHDVSLTVRVHGNTHTYTDGKIVVSEELTASSSRKANLVANGNCPGFGSAREVPNFLFIPDGFTSAEESNFNQIVDDYVYELTNGKISSPFDILKGSINYWKVFIPSREAGTSKRGEVYVKEDGGNVKGREISDFQPQRPSVSDIGDSSKWNFRELIYMVGLPVRSQRNTSVADLKTYWKSVTGLSDGVIDAIRGDLIRSWKIIAERRLPEEKDTILGIEINDYDSVGKDPKFNYINFNSKRMSRDKMDTFLNGLTFRLKQN